MAIRQLEPRMRNAPEVQIMAADKSSPSEPR